MEAQDILVRFCGGRVLEKVRHELEHRGRTWIVDIYRGAAEGLVIAEIEVDRADAVFESPPWLGVEVSYDRRYRNSAIALWKTTRGAAGAIQPRTEAIQPEVETFRAQSAV